METLGLGQLAFVDLPTRVLKFLRIVVGKNKNGEHAPIQKETIMIELNTVDRLNNKLAREAEEAPAVCETVLPENWRICQIFGEVSGRLSLARQNVVLYRLVPGEYGYNSTIKVEHSKMMIWHPNPPSDQSAQLRGFRFGGNLLAQAKRSLSKPMERFSHNWLTDWKYKKTPLMKAGVFFV